MPGWLLSILFAVGFAALLGGGYWAYRALEKPEQPAAAATTTAPFEAPKQAAPAAAPAQLNPILKEIELTGLRLTEDAGHKAVLQFVAVNHSAADLGEVSAKVNLRAVTGKQDAEPVGTFSFKVSLGPYEAKDLKAPVETRRP